MSALGSISLRRGVHLDYLSTYNRQISACGRFLSVVSGRLCGMSLTKEF